MTETKDGGPAFPVVSLRDYFAAQALAGMLANGFIPSSANDMTSGAPEWNYTKAAYILADAMLACRKAGA